jgi:hypothetical protein
MGLYANPFQFRPLQAFKSEQAAVARRLKAGHDIEHGVP